MSRKSFSLMEFVIAAVLIVAVFGMSSTVLSSTIARQRDGDEKTNAGRIAFETLEKASALGCGLATTNDTKPLDAAGNPQASSNGDTLDRARRCFDMFAPQNPDETNQAFPASSTAGMWASDPDPQEFLKFRNHKQYFVSFQTQWLTANTTWPESGPPSTVLPPAQPSCSSPPPDAPRPALAKQTVTVYWDVHDWDTQKYQSVTVTAFQTTPPDAVAFNDPRSGAVLVEADATGTASVQQMPAGPIITKRGEPDQCMWFASLPPASYRINNTQVVTVNPSSTTAVP